MPYMTIVSPGSRTPALTDSAQASTVPAVTGVPARSPVAAAGLRGDRARRPRSATAAAAAARPGATSPPSRGPSRRRRRSYMRVALARGVVVEDVLAGEPVDEERARHEEQPGRARRPRARGGRSQRQLRPDGLARQRRAGAAQDRLGAELVGQFGDLRGRRGCRCRRGSPAAAAARSPSAGSSTGPIPLTQTPTRPAGPVPRAARGRGSGSRPTRSPRRRARPSRGAGTTSRARRRPGPRRCRRGRRARPSTTRCRCRSRGTSPAGP